MIKFNTQAGFSAPELLITLFIAVALMGTAYQLYTVVIDDGNNTQLRAVASNIAYTTLQKYTSQVTKPCGTVTPSPTPTIPASANLPPLSGSAATITVTIACAPNATGTSLSSVKVSILYGIPQQEVVHATYVTK